MGKSEAIIVRDQRIVDAENILIGYGIDPDHKLGSAVTFNPNPIKDSVMETNNLCEHRKDCCHPWCACGLGEVQGNASLNGLDPIQFRKAIKRGPIDNYNYLIAARNRKVEKGIPLSYGR